MLGAALVLLYGGFLLVARTILLIFLILTSSIAFASYLIPKWANGRLGWSAWWSSLIQCATLGPILMLLLFVTLNVATAIHNKVGQGAGKGSFGDLAAHPASAANTGLFFSYFLILGLLFLSFRLASSTASKIGGFNLAALATALPFTMASRYVAGPLGRQFLGRRGARQALGLEEDIDKAKMVASTTKDYRPVEKLMRQQQRAEKKAGRSYNIMNTGAAKAIMQGIGVSGFATGANAKATSFAEQAKAKAEKASKAAAGLEGVSEKQKELIRNGATEAEATRRRERREDVTERRKAAVEQKTTIETALKSQTEPLQHQQEREEAARKQMQQQQATREADFERQISAAAAGTQARSDAEQRYLQVKAEHKSALDEQDDKIRNVHEQIATLREPVAKLEKSIGDYDDELENLKDNSQRTKGEIAAAQKKAVTEAEEGVREVAKQVGARLAYGSLSSALQQAIGIDPAKKVAGNKAFQQTKKHMRVKKQVESFAQLRDDAKGVGESLDDGSPAAPTAEKKK
jgi:hypothetical protein